MIRTLAIIALAGFVLSAVSFSIAVAIGGPEALAQSAWRWGGRGWDEGEWTWGLHGGDRRGHRRHADLGPQATRELAWDGSQSLDVDLPADVTYTQGAGPAKLTITGPQNVIQDVEVDDGHIRLNGRPWRMDHLAIALTAPDVKRFGLHGSGRMEITGYNQDSLRIQLSGSSDVVARGRTRDVELDISGSGEADLSQLAADAADVEISGSGEAVIAPKTSARLEVSGSGDITLMTRPERIATDISGSGRIHQGSESSNSPSPSPSPSSSASPSPSAPTKKR
jgi:hypothetical protein